MVTLANQDAITAYLGHAGFTADQIAGVEGNLAVESGGNPAAVNLRENAHGIAQWEGQRWLNLQHYAAGLGTAPDNLNTQLGFMLSELQGPERSAGVALSQTTSATQAATVFDQQYERSSASSLPARVAAAQAIAGGGVVGGSGANLSGGGGVQNASWNPLDWPGEISSAMGNGLLHSLAPVGRLAVDVGLVILGAVAILAGVLVLARSSADHAATVVLDDRGKGAGAGGGSEAADAAEVAAA